MRRFLFDTNICIYIIRQRHPDLADRLRPLKVGQVVISAITQCELQFGVARSADPARNQQALDRFLAPLEVLDFPTDAAVIYGRLRADLVARGQPIGALDMLIAAHALHQGCILVTNNTGEFSRVPGLKVEDWTKPMSGA